MLRVIRVKDKLCSNIPTEEVFTAHRLKVNGYVTNKLPLSYNGNIIDNFTLTFKDGAVVDYKAEKVSQYYATY